jgi:hypothetical protein
VNEGGRNLDQEFGFVYFRWFGKALKEGLFKGHPFEIVSGGLHGAEKGWRISKRGKTKLRNISSRLVKLLNHSFLILEMYKYFEMGTSFKQKM